MNVAEENGWGVRDVAGLVRELERDLSDREAQYPALVTKGRMNIREVEQQLAILRDIRADLLFAFAPLGDGEIRHERSSPRSRGAQRCGGSRTSSSSAASAARS
jgi:hypothetical protein